MELLHHQQTSIAPEYLLQLSKQVDSLNKLAILDRQGSLTQQFSRVLQEQFKELAQLLAMYGDDQVMKDTAIVKCKLALEFYVWEKANILLGSVAQELSLTMGYLHRQLSEQMTSLERLVHRERAEKAELLDAEKGRIITSLRRDLGVKREYMLDLEERVREVEDENSKLYSKMITNTKHKVDYFSKSPVKIHAFRSTSSDRPSSPHKKILPRPYQDEIGQILESKWKIEGINDRRTSLADYLRTYFTMKYGKPLAEQNQAVFRDALAYLAKNQERHMFVLFQAVLEEECDEAFILEERTFLERVIKCLKRYLNERYSRPLHELEKLFEGRTLEEKNDFYLSQGDVETLLTNIYKSGEVRTLQMIFSELASSRSSEPFHKLSCRRLINELLDYELKKHLMRVEDIVREIGRLPDRVDLLSLGHLQKVALRVIHDRERCELFLQGQLEERRWTASEAIEAIERARHIRLPRRNE